MSTDNILLVDKTVGALRGFAVIAGLLLPDYIPQCERCTAVDKDPLTLNALHLLSYSFV